jgi:hypothetical protein
MRAKLKLKRKSEDIITPSAWGPHVIKHPRPQQWTKGTGKTDLTILINGKPLSIPMLAANAVFPLPLGPSRRHVSRGVFSLFFTCSTKFFTVCSACACLVPQFSIPFNLCCPN